jgi:hypothetical protein
LASTEAAENAVATAEPAGPAEAAKAAETTAESIVDVRVAQNRTSLPFKSSFYPTAVYVPSLDFGRVVAIFIENMLLFLASMRFPRSVRSDKRAWCRRLSELGEVENALSHRAG